MKRLAVIAVVLALTVPAAADWFPEQPAKWVQFPDLDYTGIDVNATAPYILADDFLCIETGPITDIHIWGSWYHDMLPAGSHVYHWNARNVASGVYVYRLKAGEYMATKTLVLMR